jgi:serine/threonine-protein kinase
VGDIVGARFRVDGFLGAGGMGAVYAATNLGTGARVALKLLRPDRDRSTARRFLDEARLATAVRHPNVIEIQDVFEDDDGTPVMVMELLEGETLAARLARVGTLSMAEAAPIFLCVARAVCAAHERGVVHRDLKPDNIYLLEGASEPLAKVLDFGIAKNIDPAGLHVPSYASSTQHGALLGTVPYMSFEQAMGHKIDKRTDVWSFAVTMIEAMSGRRPLQYTTIAEMFSALYEQRVPRAQSLVPELPSAIASALDECLVKDREKRAPSLQRAVVELEAYLSARGRPARRKSWILAVCVAAVVATSAAAWMTRRTPGEAVPASGEPRRVAEVVPLSQKAPEVPARTPVAVDSMPSAAESTMPTPEATQPAAAALEATPRKLASRAGREGEKRRRPPKELRPPTAPEAGRGPSEPPQQHSKIIEDLPE